MVRWFTALAALAMLLSWTSIRPSIAAEADNCQGAKLLAASNFAVCLLNPARRPRLCEIKFGRDWNLAETFAGCPTAGDRQLVQQVLSEYVDSVIMQIDGTGQLRAGALQCGDGIIDVGEDCDQGDLDGGTCVGEGFEGGTIACGPNCAYDTSGCEGERFVDNGDGTVTDHKTGLMWEKKTGVESSVPVNCSPNLCVSRGTVDSGWLNNYGTPSGSGLTDLCRPWPSNSSPSCADLHDVNHVYDWPGAQAEFVSLLNGASDDGFAGMGFAGHSDWRLPTISELRTLVDRGAPGCGVGGSCVDPMLGPTQPDPYHSGTTNPNDASGAWNMDFEDGTAFASPDRKYQAYFFSSYVRAVRGVCAESACDDAASPGECNDTAFLFEVPSSEGDAGANPAHWPGGTQTRTTTNGHCSVEVELPSGRIDLVGRLGDRFAVRSFSGYSSCVGLRGEDGDGCGVLECTSPSAARFCEAGRPSCSSALNGSGRAYYSVVCRR